MKYAIVYSSQTGNTKMLASTIQETLKKEDCLYIGAPSEEAKTADVIFAGFWTDKGQCNEEMAEFLKAITHQKVFLFGTAGFGGSPAYFDQIIGKVSSLLTSDAEVVGSYMCQGKMPMSVRERYEKMKGKPGLPFDVDLMIKNFDLSLSHPDTQDLEDLKKAVQKFL